MKIIVNGTDHHVASHRAISYEAIVAMTGLGKGDFYTIVYVHTAGDGTNTEGMLYPEHEVMPKNGMRFTCVVTNNA